ncbi:MbcA/ParS/Xre antitoxin family protein [Pseudomonas sp. NBRC 111119]|uniref:antitoxin Xre/MbcA/ParS toxin-binding domain-containing protein n=1 Tax=Pseudomonas sp. NBRC 111119 TaxID=1661034 RepID=UPI0009E98D56
MNMLEIVAPCNTEVISCWSLDHRSHIARYQQICWVANQVFGNSALSADWMKTSRVEFGGQAPCFLLSTSSGYSVIYKWLMRLDHGICI